MRKVNVVGLGLNLRLMKMNEFFDSKSGEEQTFSSKFDPLSNF